MTVCVDASLAVRMLSREPGSDEAAAWFAAHIDDDIVAPSFLPAEVASAMRRKALRGEMTPEQAVELLESFAAMGIRLSGGWETINRALVLAEELGQPTVYDAVYLALAEQEGCDLWTADAAFVKAASTKHPNVRLL